MQKPYAIPLQMIPCRGLTDEHVREFASKLTAEMNKLGLNVCGMIQFFRNSISQHVFSGLVTDGEFNSLRGRGSKRPVNVLQIKADVRANVARIGIEKLRKIFMPRRMSVE